MIDFFLEPFRYEFMQRGLLVAVLLGLSLGIQATCLGVEDPSPESEMEQIRVIESKRLQALVAGQIDVAMQYHADDFQLISPSGSPFSRDDYLGSIASGKLRYLVFEAVSKIDVRLHGNAAIIRYRSNMLIAWEGTKGNPFRCWHTDLYEKRDGRWLAVWSQATGYWYGTSETALPPDKLPATPPATATPVDCAPAAPAASATDKLP